MELKKHLNGSGLLRVSGGHSLYWEDWGNSEAKVPVFFLHGGPGGGIKESDKLLFDPLRQRVIFFDQRGSGLSKPRGETENNTTQELIGDIDRLRKHLNIGVISVAGGSWGSTLSLLYAIENPEAVQKILIWATWLVRKADFEDIYQGQAVKYHFPDVWQRYIEMVPDLERKNTAAYFIKQFEHRDKAVRQRFVNEWLIFEASLSNFDENIARITIDQSASKNEDEDLAFAKIEAHYISNNCFIDNNYILNNVKSIKHIPTTIVHGRYDFLCPPYAAFELRERLGENGYLHLVPSNHSRSTPALKEVVKAYARSL